MTERTVAAYTPEDEANLVRVREINQRVYSLYISEQMHSDSDWVQILIESNVLDDLTGWELVNTVTDDQYSGEYEVELTFEKVL